MGSGGGTYDEGYMYSPQKCADMVIDTHHLHYPTMSLYPEGGHYAQERHACCLLSKKI